MRTHVAALLLLSIASCCLLRSAQGQDAPRRSVWDDPVTFSTKAKDACAMHVTGQGDQTTLRVACRGRDHDYWCEYRGKPQTCRSYNNNPRHYFTQIMWDLRKLQNACKGPRAFKPQMCKKASNEARMVFIGESESQQTSRYPPATRPQPPTRPQRQQPTKPQPPTRAQPVRPTKTQQAKEDQGRPLPPRTGSRNNNNNYPQRRTTTANAADLNPTQSTSKMAARKMAQDYCWRSLQGVCTYVIGLFRN